MDEKVKLSTQMDSGVGPVILINKFNVEPDDADQFLKVWAADSAIMKTQPGFISAQLHRGIAGSCVFLNYAVWESTEHYKRAFNNPEFQSSIKGYSESTTASLISSRKLQSFGGEREGFWMWIRTISVRRSGLVLSA